MSALLFSRLATGVGHACRCRLRLCGTVAPDQREKGQERTRNSWIEPFAIRFVDFGREKANWRKLSVRYYLYIVRGDEVIRDIEGEEFETLAQAIESAQQSLRDIAAEHLMQGSRMTMKAIEIYDETGRHLTSVDAVTAIAACLPPWS